MNKKNLLFKIGKSLLLLGLVVSLSSCSIIFEIIEEAILGGLENNGRENEFDYIDYKLVETPDESINKNREENKSGYNISLLDQKYQEGYEILPSTGNQKLLVIPVYFKDYTPSYCLDNTEEALANINKAFFGDSYSSGANPNKTGWESVKSYYNKSSYGKFNLDGMVTSWCPLSKTLEEVALLEDYTDPTIWVLREAVSWLKINYPDVANEFDQDNDGYIDAVALIYPNEYYDNSYKQEYDRKYDEETLESIEYILWAYTYWDYNQKPNKQSPVANVYTWLSYDFFFDGGYKEREYYPGGYNENYLVDCHTLIHEFGHVLGLDDYYSYDYLDDEPLGRLDMMDMNIGDHNSFSKYLLNWLEPILIEEPGEYTITSLTKDGTNALLIPADIDKFSYSPFSEYLLIEFYTPTELNELDSKERYKGVLSSNPYLFTKSGVKILHVDSRLVVANNLSKTYYYTSINNDIINTPNDMQFIGANNTSSYSINSKFKLVNLISSEKGKNAFDSNYYATNRDLFTKGDMITSFSFNSGTELQFNIEITQINGNDSAVISITYR